MKNNKKLLLPVLVLCLAMLAFGVYAAKNAKLTASGTVGFIAHDCMADVSATIIGDAYSVETALTDPDAPPSALREFIPVTSLGLTEDTINVVYSDAADAVNKVPTIYFSDLTPDGVPETITITFRVENKSAYPITATLTNGRTEAEMAPIVVSFGEANVEIAALNNTDDTDVGTLSVNFDLSKTTVDNVEDYHEIVTNIAYSLRVDLRKATGGVTPGPGGGEETPDAEPLPAPEVISFDSSSKELVISAVDGASAYRVGYFKKDELVATEKMPVDSVNGYVLTNDITVSGNYVVKVLAVGNGTNADSEYTEAGTINVIKDTLTTAEGLEVQGLDSLGNVAYVEENIASYMITGIGDFEGTTLNIPASYNEKPITVLGVESMVDGTNLETVIIPEGVTKIDEQAFYGCRKLTSVSLPNSLVEIGSYGFANCSALTSLTIPENVTTIGMVAFYNCRGLTSIVVDENNTTFDSRNNCNAIIQDNTLVLGCVNTAIPTDIDTIGAGSFLGITALTSINIPNNITTIGSTAFSYTGLTQIIIPASVQTLGNSVFSYCESLTNVTISEGVQTIGDKVFSDCSSLYTVVIPASVKALGEEVFSGRKGVSRVIFEGKVESIGENLVWNNNSITIYVPDEHYDYYSGLDVFGGKTLYRASELN